MIIFNSNNHDARKANLIIEKGLTLSMSKHSLLVAVVHQFPEVFFSRTDDVASGPRSCS